MPVDPNTPARATSRREVENYSASTMPEDDNSVDGRLDDIESEYVQKSGAQMEGTLELADWAGTQWHDTVVVTQFTETPPIVLHDPANEGRALGFLVYNNHLVIAETTDGTNWEAIGFFDHASGVGANNLIRFLSDSEFDTGFISAEGITEDRIGIGLATNFLDANFDNPALSEIRWWFGTSGDYDFVPGKHNSYDVGEAARSVRNLYMGTGVYFSETSDPAAPAANSVVLFARDSGGKTQLCARFPTGAIQQVAIEP